MLIPLKIRFKNLFSHVDTSYVFKRDEMSLFVGINEDEPGTNSNGAGKSSTIEAITLALTGEVYRGLTKEYYIRTGQDSCEVIFTLYNSIQKQTVVIKREIFANKSSKLDVSINSVSSDILQSKNKMKLAAQDFIYEMLGFTKEDLFNFFVIGQENENSFFSSTDTKQKEVISRFSNYNKIDIIIEKIKEDIKKNQEQTENKEFDLHTAFTQATSLKEQIEELKHDSTFLLRKSNLNDEIEMLHTKIETHQYKIADIVKSKQDIEKQLQVLKTDIKEKIDIITLKKQLTEIRSLKTSQEEVLNELKEIKGQLSVQNGKLVTCPKCQFVFVPDSNMTAEEVAESKEHIENEIILANQTLIKHDKKIESIKLSISKLETLQEKENHLQNVKERLRQASEINEDYKLKIKDKKDELNNLKPNESNQHLIDLNTNKLKKLNKDAVTYKKELDDLIIQKEDLQFNLFVFQKQFRTFISNKTIRTIQDIANYYLEKFQVNLRVFISGFKVNKDGTVRDKIEIWVMKNGKDRMPFKALSGGEKARIKLCGVLSLRKLINNSSETGGFDLLCLDELLEGLDNSGQAEIIKMMEQSKITSIMVMHHSEDFHVKNRIVTVKKDGVSTIVK